MSAAPGDPPQAATAATAAPRPTPARRARLAWSLAVVLLGLSSADMLRRAALRVAEHPPSARLAALRADEEVVLQRAAGPALGIARALQRFVPDARHLLLSHDQSRWSQVVFAFLPALVFPYPSRVHQVALTFSETGLLAGFEGTICLVRLQPKLPVPVAKGFLRVARQPGFDIYVWTGP